MHEIVENLNAHQRSEANDNEAEASKVEVSSVENDSNESNCFYMRKLEVIAKEIADATTV